ncbi:MAG: hypothetical protein PHH77_00995 [Victivallaceae bacterium]|nr:hypothetical protein [Victivallaceae bacterium]
MRNILLLEPNYKNKYPPMGLMKIAKYHRMLGDNVVFFKGDLKVFVLEEITRKAIASLADAVSTINWENKFPEIMTFIKTGHIENGSELEVLRSMPLASPWFKYYREYYYKRKYFDEKPWDRVCVTTLFTFYWEITIETILFAKKLVKDPKQILVGGVMATVVADEVKKATGIKPYKGCINKKSILGDHGININIDDLSLDYSILHEIDYEYPEMGSYYGYTTRGCKNGCPFCAVPIIEPEFKDYLPLTEKIEETRRLFGDQHHLLLLDNNVLASDCFFKIIDEIKSCGFAKDAKYRKPNQFEIAIARLMDGYNDRAYIRRSVKLLREFVNKLSGEEQQTVYKLLSDNLLLNHYTATKEKIYHVYEQVKELYESKRPRGYRNRYVDFNQGVDARRITDKKMKKLSEVAIRPLRIAFDDWKSHKIYRHAVELAAKYKIKNLSNYLLYNFNDKPVDLYRRMKLNVELCETLDLNIYSFPMKYHPIMDSDYFQNREYTGKYWNRKFIRAIQAVLNATKGKIGKGKEFFEKAFGANEEEFEKILYMPETFIIYRFYFEGIGQTQQWWSAYSSLPDKEKEAVNPIIHSNDFSGIDKFKENKKIYQVLSYYTITRTSAQKVISSTR